MFSEHFYLQDLKHMERNSRATFCKPLISGDSGGPNIYFDPFEDGRYVQIGIVSGGIACTSKPGVYANLGKVMFKK